LQASQRAVESFGDARERASLPQRGDCRELPVGCASAIGLEFEREAAAIVHDEDIGNASDDAEALENRGLNRAPVTAVWSMKCEKVWPLATAQVFEHGALDCVLRAAAAHVSALQ